MTTDIDAVVLGEGAKPGALLRILARCDNVPMRDGQDPHSRIAEIPAAFEMAAARFRTGVLEQRCGGARSVDDLAP
jgi:hypothetical protein